MGVRRKARMVRTRRRRSVVKRRNGFNGLRVHSRIARAPIITTKVLQNRGRDITVIKHREYLDQVLCPQAAYSYVLQPTNTSMFTWLPKVAQCFEMYRLVKMIVNYESTTGTESSGAVHMGFDYDVLDDTVPDEHELSQFTTWLRTGLWKSAAMPLVPALANRVPWHYTASHGYPAVSDRKMYDVGRLWVMGSGTGDAIAAGELYVEYEFQFCSPTIEVVPLTKVTYPVTPANNTDHYEIAAAAPVVANIVGQKLMEYVGRSLETFPVSPVATATKYVDVFKALHGFVGEALAEGGVPLSAVHRAQHVGLPFVESSSGPGHAWALMTDENGDKDMATQKWRAPPINFGNSASDQVAGMLGIGSVHLQPGKYYAFPWKNDSTGPETGWSTPVDIVRNLTYFFSASLPHLFDAVGLANQIVLSPACSSSEFTRIEPDDEDEECVVVRRKR